MDPSDERESESVSCCGECKKWVGAPRGKESVKKVLEVRRILGGDGSFPAF